MSEDFILKASSIKYVEGKDGVIGNGGFGTVRKAIFNGTTVVAVKTLEFKAAVKNTKAEDLRKMALKLFIAEAKTMRQVKDHPRIVKFIGYVYDTHSIVMEYVSGGTLFHYIQDSPETKTCMILKPLLSLSIRSLTPSTYY